MLLSILLIRGLMLPGAMDGIHFYLGKYVIGNVKVTGNQVNASRAGSCTSEL